MIHIKKKTILIADSGATKADWCLVQGKQIVRRFSGKGISPIFQSKEEMEYEIRDNVLPQLVATTINAVYFYGAGCIPDKIPLVTGILSAAFPAAKIQVNSDLTGVAHALCGREAGIACILGTGSNSCEWDGTKPTHQIPSLGFILGDEGSGAALGKHLLNKALKHQLTGGLKEALFEEYNLTVAVIIDRVYRQPFPSRFLASLSPFIFKHRNDPSIRGLLHQCFDDFFEKNVMHYNYQENKVHIVGSIGWYYADVLKEVAEEKGIQVGKIAKSPIEGLIDYIATSPGTD